VDGSIAIQINVTFHRAHKQFYVLWSMLGHGAVAYRNGGGEGLRTNSPVVDKIQRFQALILEAYTFPVRMGREKTIIEQYH
jgi:hypothetical protein